MPNSTQCGDVVLFLRQTQKHSETMFLFHTISMSCTIPYWIFILPVPIRIECLVMY